MTKVHALVLDKLIRGQIVDGMVVVNWLFLPTTVQDFHKYETKNGQINMHTFTQQNTSMLYTTDMILSIIICMQAVYMVL